MAGKSLLQYLAEAKQRDNYWIEHTKLDFSSALERQRRRAGLSYKALAEKLGTSPAYISKVFRGDANLTIESMVKLARAVDGQLHLEIAGQADGLRWFSVIAGNANAFYKQNADAWRQAKQAQPSLPVIDEELDAYAAVSNFN